MLLKQILLNYRKFGNQYVLSKSISLITKTKRRWNLDFGGKYSHFKISCHCQFWNWIAFSSKLSTYIVYILVYNFYSCLLNDLFNEKLWPEGTIHLICASN